MQKQYYTSNGQPYTGLTNKQGRKLKNAARNKSGQTVLNIDALQPSELAELCDLYQYQVPDTKKTNGKKLGKLIFDEKTDTCTHELVELTTEEIKQREDEEMRMQFEQEQIEKEEKEREEKFKAWKAEKEAEKQVKEKSK